MGALLSLARILFGKLNMCSLAGALVGVIAGFFFGLFQIEKPGLALTWNELAVLGLVLGFVGWLFVLLVIGVWLRYGASSIALQSLVTAALTSLLTVYLNSVLKLPALAVPIGLIVGIVVGYLLCLACRDDAKRGMRRSHA